MPRPAFAPAWLLTAAISAAEMLPGAKAPKLSPAWIGSAKAAAMSALPAELYGIESEFWSSSSSASWKALLSQIWLM